MEIQRLKKGKILVIEETGFDGLVGECIITYQYWLLEMLNGVPTPVPITSVEDYKRLVYPLEFKKDRINTWAAIKNESLFGYCTEPWNME